MDKVVSTVILASVTVALAITLATYYSDLVGLFMRHEQLSFDYAYATVKDGQAEIVINFRNTGQVKLTVISLEINGEQLVPKGKNPFPLELPYGTKAKLKLHAGLDLFRNGMTYEVVIKTASGGKYVKAVVIP